ncbi:tyrosine-type recombinase/integrase [Candidatus Clostridium stratigraminis]|uniref:Tyrosine-type recombinase/integrase n=1 Tax=Candidatus Clostridium stratigraminis TaxID=3381661 RepID=A0ABW8T3U4_9CLOT
MIIVKEQKKSNENFYNVETYNQNNTLIYTEKIHLRSAIVEKNKQTYFILYDENMLPIKQVFRYLNFSINALSINSREKGLHALKLLYVFSKIINKDIADFSKTDISNLIDFLRGFSPEGQVISFEITTSRNFETINGYFSVYRSYMKYLNLKDSLFLTKSEKEVTVMTSEYGVEMKINPYEITEKGPSVNDEVPMYISVEEFKSIISLIRKEYSKREECIVRLMYQCGLRIGEVLGLTADDLTIEKIEDEYVAVAYLRNRLSDKKTQLAKTCMKVIDKKQYKLKEYNTINWGFQRVIIPMDLYDLLNEYIDEAHVNARENKHNNYYKYTIADRVRNSEEDEDDNYYVFLNSLGKPLLSPLWNHTLREIFKKTNISVDTDVRESNLNHRFRHGYAMYQVKYLNVKILDLQRKLRHRNVASVYCYYRPTISDEIQLKNEFTQELYTIIPELVFTKEKEK